MNSFSGVERALEVEFARQVAILESGGSVQKQTMLFDPNRIETRPPRSKEESHDYRYFPEPDLPPLRLSDEWLESIRRDLPELPASRRARFVRDLGLPAYDAEVLTAERGVRDYFEGVVASHNDPKAVANRVMGEVMARLNEAGVGIGECRVTPGQLGALPAARARRCCEQLGGADDLSSDVREW